MENITAEEVIKRHTEKPESDYSNSWVKRAMEEYATLKTAFLEARIIAGKKHYVIVNEYCDDLKQLIKAKDEEIERLIGISDNLRISCHELESELKSLHEEIDMLRNEFKVIAEIYKADGTEQMRTRDHVIYKIAKSNQGTEKE
jgi:predicted nuclease with TOPRIM domain